MYLSTNTFKMKPPTPAGWPALRTETGSSVFAQRLNGAALGEETTSDAVAEDNDGGRRRDLFRGEDTARQQRNAKQTEVGAVDGPDAQPDGRTRRGRQPLEGRRTAGTGEKRRALDRRHTLDTGCRPEAIH